MTAPVRPFAEPALIGESFVGEGPNAAHINVVIGRKGGANVRVIAPFGGFKQSGSGRDKSLHALDGHTQLKTTWLDLP